MEQITIDYIKTVVQDGARSPGQKDFYLEVSGFESQNMETDLLKVSGNVIKTNGPGPYTGCMIIEYPDTCHDDMQEGFYVEEVNDGAAYWTYSDMVYFIGPDDEGVWRIHDKVPEGSTRHEMNFENKYTRSPSRDRDDDDRRPIRVPQEDKKPTPQQDEEKPIPDTGCDTKVNYLVYLFHKYFSWAI